MQRIKDLGQVADFGTSESGLKLESLLGQRIKSLLIKGAPGSGKTTLALELINGNSGGAYISTRGDQSRLITHFPSLAGFKDSDAAQKGQSEVSPEFTDLTLASASDIIEELLQTIRKPEGVLLVLDSWDAIAKEMEPVDRLRAERTMIAAINATDNSKLVLVSEEPQLTTTDYLVDGVVYLNDGDFEGRRMRQLCLAKLRGTLIPQKEYLYSLDGGRFKLLPPVSLMESRSQVSPRNKPTRNNGSPFSTGSKDLDSLIRVELEGGSYILLELGSTLGPKYHLPFLVSIRINFLLNGGGVVVIPTASVSPEDVKRGLTPYVDNSILENGLRIGSLGSSFSDPCFFSLEKESDEGSFKTSQARMEEIRSKTNGRIFSTIGLDSMVVQYGIEEVKQKLNRWQHEANLKGDVRLHIVKPGSEITQYASNICTLHLKLEEIHGSLVLFSKKPPSILYGVKYDYSEGYPKVMLTPIV